MQHTTPPATTFLARIVKLTSSFCIISMNEPMSVIYSWKTHHSSPRWGSISNPVEAFIGPDTKAITKPLYWDSCVLIANNKNKQWSFKIIYSTLHTVYISYLVLVIQFPTFFFNSFSYTYTHSDLFIGPALSLPRCFSYVSRWWDDTFFRPLRFSGEHTKTSIPWIL